MTRSPRFEDLVGSELPAEERSRLERVHDLLVDAGPPPGLREQLDEPGIRAAPKHRRRGIWATVAVAAALAAAAFVGGYALGNRGDGERASQRSLVVRVVRLHGTAGTPDARAAIRVARRDSAGNWGMRITVEGLRPLHENGYYTVALANHGRPVVVCGTFNVRTAGRTTLRMSVAYGLDEFDRWVVTAYRHGEKRQPIVLTS